MPKPDKRPSIIKEIFIYDKPNKPAVPQDYSSEDQVTLSSGDIILTRSKTKAEPIDVKSESPSEDEEEVQDTTPKNNIENVVDFANSLIGNILSSEADEPEFLKHSKPKRQYGKKQKGADKPIIIEDEPPKKTAISLKIKNPKHQKLEEKCPFKTPIPPPPKQVENVNPKETAKVLNFFIKHPSLDVTVVAPVRDDSVYLLNEDNEPEVIAYKSKRTRKLPKRFNDDNFVLEETVGHYPAGSREKPVAKRKKVEEDKQISSEEDKQISSEEDKQISSEEDEEMPEDSEPASEEEGFQSDDEDGPREWMPPEYAEYKQEFATKQKAAAKKYKCKSCDQVFESYYVLRKHTTIEHGDSVQTYQADDSNEEAGSKDSEDDQAKARKGFKCKICLLTFRTYYNLSRHRKEKHLDADHPYDCHICEEKFADLSTFTAHIRSAHHGKDPYECQKCKKGFQTSEELVRHSQVHVLQKAEIVKRYRCDICAKEFGKLSDIERHTRVHTGEKPSQCHICHKRFQQSHNLTKHLLIHMQVKPFQCEICHKKFGRIDVLNRHLLTHSVEKPFKCSFCDKSFIRQVQLSMHLDRRHPDADYNDDD